MCTGTPVDHVQAVGERVYCQGAGSVYGYTGTLWPPAPALRWRSISPACHFSMA